MLLFKRKKFIVNTNIQYRLVFFSLSYVLFFSLAIFLSLFLPLIMEMHTSEGFSSKTVQAANVFLFLHDHLLPIALLSAITIGLHSIYICHKIAGPLYRFSLMFTAIKEGRLPKPASLRKGDYLLTEMAVINEMVASLRDRVSDIQQAQMFLSQDIATLQEVAVRGTPDEMMEQIKSLAERGAQFGDKLRAIQIEA
jgi:hypothetical protein